jgi:hypothetical protein
MQPNYISDIPCLINWQRRIYEANDLSESSVVQALANCPTDVGDNCETIVPAIVISHE